MGHFDGKVAIVTGSARGVGRAHAMLLASEGAKVIVNDLGGEWDGTGADNRPAQQTVDEIKAAGGEASANYDNVASWEGGQNLIKQALETYGDLHILINKSIGGRMAWHASCGPGVLPAHQLHAEPFAFRIVLQPLANVDTDLPHLGRLVRARAASVADI